MNNISARFGYWSALMALMTFLLFTACFVAIAIVNPLFKWTNLQDYLNYASENNQLMKHIAQFTMILFAVFYVILLNSLHDFTSDSKKFFCRLAIYFGLAFMVAISIHYFIQITGVRLSIKENHTIGLEQFVQANPISASSSINMLGWTLFFWIIFPFCILCFLKRKN